MLRPYSNGFLEHHKIGKGLRPSPTSELFDYFTLY